MIKQLFYWNIHLNIFSPKKSNKEKHLPCPTSRCYTLIPCLSQGCFETNCIGWTFRWSPYLKIISHPFVLCYLKITHPWAEETPFETLGWLSCAAVVEPASEFLAELPVHSHHNLWNSAFVVSARTKIQKVLMILCLLMSNQQNWVSKLMQHLPCVRF